MNPIERREKGVAEAIGLPFAKTLGRVALVREEVLLGMFGEQVPAQAVCRPPAPRRASCCLRNNSNISSAVTVRPASMSSSPF